MWMGTKVESLFLCNVFSIRNVTPVNSAVHKSLNICSGLKLTKKETHVYPHFVLPNV